MTISEQQEWKEYIIKQLEDKLAKKNLKISNLTRDIDGVINIDVVQFQNVLNWIERQKVRA